MITARFFCKGSLYTGFEVSGHAGYDDAGRDIVCAAVSALVQSTVQGITEVVGRKARVMMDDAGEVTLHLIEARNRRQEEQTQLLIEVLYRSLEGIAMDYSEFFGLEKLNGDGGGLDV